MLLIEEFEKSGRGLFRWRSYLPLGLIAVIAAALRQFGYPNGSHVLDMWWELICLAVSLTGLAVRILTVGYASRGTSGRNTWRQVAEDLNRTGMYSLVRHPLYLGNFLMALGVFMFLRVWWLPIIYALAFALYYERIMFAEEAFLRQKFGQAYMEWADRIPAFILRRLRWEKPVHRCSWKTILKRESPSLSALCCTMLALEMLGDFRQTGRLVLDPVWLTMAASTLLLFLVIRALRKSTHLLDTKPAPGSG